MTKKKLFVTKIWALNGYTFEQMATLTVSAFSTDGYLYFTDSDGNSLKASTTTTEPVPVDSHTTSISLSIVGVSPTAATYYLGSNSAYTAQLAVYNQDGINVITECVFSSSTVGVATVGYTTGLITGIDSGTSTITVYHNDHVSASTALVVGDIITGLTAAASGFTVTVATGATHTGLTTFVDQLGDAVPASKLTFTSSAPTKATVSATTGVVTGVATGTTIITATVKDSGLVPAASTTYTITVTA